MRCLPVTLHTSMTVAEEDQCEMLRACVGQRAQPEEGMCAKYRQQDSNSGPTAPQLKAHSFRTHFPTNFERRSLSLWLRFWPELYAQRSAGRCARCMHDINSKAPLKVANEIHRSADGVISRISCCLPAGYGNSVVYLPFQEVQAKERLFSR